MSHSAAKIELGIRVVIGNKTGTVVSVENDKPLRVNMDEGPVWIRPAHWRPLVEDFSILLREAA